VDTSDLRVAFGGLASPSTQQNTPGADILFDEMDPFTLGLTSTNAPNVFSSGPSGPFVPIRRPQVRLNRNLSNWTSTSFTEAFFLTVAHEMGHALGLQHTFTASLMSTEVAGRATSLYAPLAADDHRGHLLSVSEGEPGAVGRQHRRPDHVSGRTRHSHGIGSGDTAHRSGSQRVDRHGRALSDRWRAGGPVLAVRPSGATVLSRRGGARRPAAAGRPGWKSRRSSRWAL